MEYRQRRTHGCGAQASAHRRQALFNKAGEMLVINLFQGLGPHYTQAEIDRAHINAHLCEDAMKVTEKLCQTAITSGDCAQLDSCSWITHVRSV